MRRMQIVDIQADLEAEQRRRRGLLLRYGLSIASVILIVAGLIGVTLFTRGMNERDVLALSKEFIRILDDRVDSEVRSYLAPASDSVQLLSSALPEAPFSEAGQEEFEGLAADVLERQPQISSLYLGSTAGEFILVRRNAEGSYDRKSVTFTSGKREVLWLRRDASGKTAFTESTPDDSYDPRNRGWFKGALEGDKVYWTDVYVFFTDQTPGITAAKTAPLESDGETLVVGADIQLEKLGGFLGSLQRESRGKLAIVENNGDFVAFSETAKIIVEEGEGLRPLNIRELNDPAISEAFDRVRVLGRGQSSVTIDGVHYLLASSSLQASVGRDWLLLMLSPEEAYVGFIAANSRSGLFASAIVVVLAVLLAGFLAYQGYLAERDTRRLRRDQAKLAKQSEAFEELSALPSFADNGDQTSLRRALELMVELSGAQRVSLWRLSHRRQEMIALATYDSEGKSHTSGALLRGGDFPAFFSEMRQGKEVHLRNATADPRAAALHMTYLRPVGVSGIISHPVERKDQTIGALWLEYRGEAPEEESGSGFAQMLANLAAPLIAASEQERSEGEGRTLEVVKGSPAAVAALAELRGARLCDERAIRVERRLGPEGKSGAALFPNTTVLALKFFDDSSLAASLKDEQSPLVIRRIVSAFQKAADEVGVPYLKILTDQIIAVDGLEGDESAAAHRLMQVALSMQDVCSSLFLELGRGPQYAFGLDTGPSVGSHVGFGQSPYNIWGESVRVALSLASSAQPGSILVSEATYELLREDYLFRRRGSYYLDQVGEMETFTLRGHL